LDVLPAQARALRLYALDREFVLAVWHHVDLEFNFSAQNFSVLLDGVLLDSDIPFCGGVFSCSGTLVIPAFGSGFFDAVIESQATGYMDNFQVATVPEHRVR
jgi:hypothetical protein